MSQTDPIPDDNVERLIGQAARPEPIDPAFVDRVHASLEEEALRRRKPGPMRRRRVLGVLAGLAAAAAVLILANRLTRPPIERPDNPRPSIADTHPSPFVSLPKSKAPEPENAAVGAEVRTAAGERKRVRLPDDSVLSLNQNTRVRVESDRKVSLVEGEVFVEVAPKDKGPAFALWTGDREVKALGTRFSVRAGDKGPAVLVTQGKVKVSGIEEALTTGQELTPDGTVAEAPRATHRLAWARDLVAKFEPAPVPPPDHRGGALVVKNADGSEEPLTLRKYHVDTHVEDGFARTTIDVTYFNNQYGRLEGTFYFPLPPDASISRLAMYVEGTRMEGGMVERGEARQIFETIVRSMRDPALLEWVDGSTFKMRVFPLEGRQEKRIILSYTQRLPGLYGKATYRFPAGHNLGQTREWSFQARVKDGAGKAWSSPSHTLHPSTDKKDLVLRTAAHNQAVERDVVLELQAGTPDPAAEAVAFAQHNHEAHRYLMVRYRPALKAEAREKAAQKRHWVVLYESSANRDPVLARAQLDILRSMLRNAGHEDTFQVVVASSQAKVLTPRPLAVKPSNIDATLADLEKVRLMGALDLGKALDAAAPLLKDRTNAHLLHVGSGHARLGERAEDALLKKVPEDARYVGVGVGKRWNRSLMKRAAERTGGYFTQINPDELVAWRAFDLLATLNTPRLLDVNIEARDVKFLTETTTLAQGEELLAVARIDGNGNWPETVTVSGTLDGKAFERKLKVVNVAMSAGYLPRTWGRLEIDRMVTANGPREEVVKLSKALHVMSPYTSLLVLENEAMYRQYKVDRGLKEHWANYDCPEKIPVVYEPAHGQPGAPPAPQVPQAAGQKLPAEQVLRTILIRGCPQIVDPRLWDAGVQGIVFSPDGQMLLNGEDTTVRLWDTARTSTTWELERRNRWADTNGSIPGVNFNDYLLFSRPRGTTQLGATWTHDTNTSTGRVLTGGSSGGGRFMWNGRVREVQQLQKEQQRILTDGTILPERMTDRLESFPPWINPGQIDPGMMNPLIGRVEPSEAIGIADPEGRPTLLPMLIPPPPGTGWGKGGQLEGFSVLRGNDFLPVRFRFPGQRQAEEIGQMDGTRRLPPVIPVSYLYQRPSLHGGMQLFRDLTLHAPGMNTTDADVQGVLEAEAEPRPETAPGRIAPAARQLIERAITGNWESVTIKDEKGNVVQTLFCNGKGAYRLERILPMGLREIVICDGDSLWHLYPEIGLGAKRAVNRFHRAELAALVPWLVLPADDLARRADLEAVNKNTVAVLPHQGKTAVHLVFGDDGRLIERRLIDKKTSKVQMRVVLDRGGVRWLDADGKTRGEQKVERTVTKAPELRPDAKDLVVLPLPYRQYGVFKELPGFAVQYDLLEEDKALALAAAYFAGGHPDFAAVIDQRFLRRNDNRIGFEVLLTAGNAHLQRADKKFTEETTPLEKYLRKFDSGQAKEADSKDGKQKSLSFVERMDRLHRALELAGGRLMMRLDREEGILAELRKAESPLLAWVMVEVFTSQPAERVKELKHLPRMKLQILEAAAEGLRDFPTLGYAAEYEVCKALWLDGQKEEAQKRFVALYNRTLEAGELPMVSSEFHQSVGTEGKDGWPALARKAVDTFRKQGEPGAARVIALQSYDIGDVATGDAFVREIVKEAPATAEGSNVVWNTLRAAAANRGWEMVAPLLEEVLTKEGHKDCSDLWRMASDLAREKNQMAKAARYLDRALELVDKQQQAVSLDRFRQDHELLMSLYERLFRAAIDLEQPAPADLIGRALKAGDRWLVGDRDGPAAQRVGLILALAGQKDAAWEYLTTGLAGDNVVAQAWFDLSQALRDRGQTELANRASAEGKILQSLDTGSDQKK